MFFLNGTLFHKILIRHILLNLDSCVKAATLRKRNQRERQRIKRENARIRKQRERELKSKLNKLNELKRRKKSEAQKKWRQKKRNNQISDTIEENNNLSFENKMQKSRALKKLKSNLPKYPMKQAATIAAFLEDKNSPAVKILESIKIVPSPEEKENLALQDSVFSDIKESVSNLKMKRCNKAREAMDFLAASISGEFVRKSRSKTSLAKKLGLPIRRISKGYVVRSKIFHSESSSLCYTQRKTRSDALSDENRKCIYEFWRENSHPTGNKNDVKRVRIGPKQYSSHAVQILEKTQTEIYTDFKLKFPEIKVCQRLFEACKPYYIRAAGPKDKVTCCCRYHLEMKYVFKACMTYRKTYLSNAKLYRNMYEMAFETLCASNNDRHKKVCLDRACEYCGVNKLQFYSEEQESDDLSPDVKWDCFEYTAVKSKRGNEKTDDGKTVELFDYLRRLLQTTCVPNGKHSNYRI